MRASTAAPFALALRSMAFLRRWLCSGLYPRPVDGLGSTRLLQMAQSAHNICGNERRR